MFGIVTRNWVQSFRMLLGAFIPRLSVMWVAVLDARRSMILLVSVARLACAAKVCVRGQGRRVWWAFGGRFSAAFLAPPQTTEEKS